MTDLDRMGAEFSQREAVGEFSVISGTVPVSEMSGYHSEVGIWALRGRSSLRMALRSLRFILP